MKKYPEQFLVVMTTKMKKDLQALAEKRDRSMGYLIRRGIKIQLEEARLKRIYPFTPFESWDVDK